MLSLQDLNEKYGVRLNFLRYLRITTSIEQAAIAIKPKKCDVELPRLPPILKLSCLQSKGCQVFYKTLRAIDISKRSTAECERKWNETLGTSITPESWDKIGKINSNVLVSNKMKWVGLQIIRFILPTNYTVSQYKNSVDPGCSLCNKSHIEKLEMLLWGCSVVHNFWLIVENILKSFYPDFKMTCTEAIFGDVKSVETPVINTLLALARQFIYKQKFTSKSLDEVLYIIYMKDELKLLYNVHQMKDKTAQFVATWSQVFDHFEVEIPGGNTGEMMLIV